MDGAFIVFEGVEGGGKSTQIRLLSNQLHERGLAVLNTIEPGQTRAGRAIRDVLLDPETGSLEPMAETLLYEADRAEHVARVVRPALERGEIVLCDRYTLSTLAYQGFGRGLSLKIIEQLNSWATGGLKPDLTIVLMVSVRDGLARATRHGVDRMEEEGFDFHERVQRGYRELADSTPNCLIIDASADKLIIQKEIQDAVDAVLAQREGARPD